MEANKDEALRAKGIAEKKMENNDFEGARKIALKAQNLYPELENINHLLSICEVHCSAQKRVAGNEKDWYGILQVQSLADESTIKKQYRRLALILHPDKNRCPGAEAAFKLICEANAVLSDTQKKALYDHKLRIAVRSASVNLPPHHVNRGAQYKVPQYKGAQVNKQYGVQINTSNGFTGLNQHQATRPSFATRQGMQDVFWTHCPFCTVRYQYMRNHVNTKLKCPKCNKDFMGYEIPAQGAPQASRYGQPADQHVPTKPGTSQPADLQDKKVPNQADFKTVSQNEKRSMEAHAGFRGTAKMKGIPSEKDIKASESIGGMSNAAKESGDFHAKETSSCATNSFNPGKQGGTPNGDAINRESVELKNKNRKRSRKMVQESSESFGNSSDSEVEDVTMKNNMGQPSSNLNSGPAFVRRSSRKRHHVSYNESDDDVDGSLKRSQANESQGNGGNQKVELDGEDLKHGSKKNFPADAQYSELETKDRGTVRPEENLRYNAAGCDKESNLREETGGFGPATVEIDSDSDQETKEDPNEDKCECPDPEFSDFDKERDESRFHVNQFWACYDDLDGMPRFYAKIKKISIPFKVSFTWLEAVPINEACEEWTDGELPVGCGSFRFGQTETTTKRLSFSHLTHCDKGKKRNSFVLYPRVGEVWALFKDWDLKKWSSDPENHKTNLKYELVEVLSNYDADVGIRVGYLNKIEGFVSLFQRTGQSEADSFVIGPSDLYKFSHCVPSSRMTGSERIGVPVGSLELDPAALPLNFNDLYYPVKAETANWSGDIGGNHSPNPAKKNDKSATSESMRTPKKFVDLDEIDPEPFRVRRSPRGVNVK